MRKSGADIIASSKTPDGVEKRKAAAAAVAARGGPTAADLEEIPELTDEQLANMRPVREFWEHFKARKKLISLRVDKDVMSWFESTGEGYRKRMNDALREHMQRHIK